MTVPAGRQHPAHLFYVMMPSSAEQSGLIAHLRSLGVIGAFHYQPLHASPAGLALGRVAQPCPVAMDRSTRLVRLPLYPGLDAEQVDRVLTAVTSYAPGSVTA